MYIHAHPPMVMVMVCVCVCVCVCVYTHVQSGSWCGWWWWWCVCVCVYTQSGNLVRMVMGLKKNFGKWEGNGFLKSFESQQMRFVQSNKNSGEHVPMCSSCVPNGFLMCSWCVPNSCVSYNPIKTQSWWFRRSRRATCRLRQVYSYNLTPKP